VLDPAVATIATVPLQAYAQQNLAGMQPLTDVIAGQFKTNQYLEQTFQMTAGKCYGAAAVAAPGGIGEMNIQFVALQPIPGIPNPELARDQTTGANANIGSGGNCFKWQAPFGINVKVIYTATSGEGIAAGRVFVK
jgi:hypothetical protein